MVLPWFYIAPVRTASSYPWFRTWNRIAPIWAMASCPEVCACSAPTWAEILQPWQGLHARSSSPNPAPGVDVFPSPRHRYLLNLEKGRFPEGRGSPVLWPDISTHGQLDESISWLTFSGCLRPRRKHRRGNGPTCLSQNASSPGP